ncbi:MAG: ATP-binding protein [Pseudomonadota bacterium]
MIRRRTLFWHILPMFILVIGLALAGVTLYSTSAMEAFFLEQTRAELTARALLLTPQLSESAFSQDASVLQQIIGTPGRISGTRISLILPSGQVRADSAYNSVEMENHANRPEIAAAFRGENGSAIRFSNTLKKRMMYVALPIRQSDGTIFAVIRTALPVSAIDDKLGVIRLRLLLGGVVFAVLSVLLSMLVSRRISWPIAEIKRGAERFAAGDLDRPLPIPDASELANLVRAMNRMAAEIARRIHQAESRSREIESILASMIEGVIAVDMEANVLRINAAASRMLALSPEAAGGRSLHELIRNTAFHQLLEKSAKSGKSGEADIVFYAPSELIIHTRCAPLKDAADRRLGVLIVMNDVSQLRRLENMRRDFAANVSHEIKTPLTAIKGFVETLRHTAVDDPEAAARFLQIIEKHVNRLAAIIEDLMQLSRIERDSAGEDLFLREHRLKDILQTAIQICNETSALRSVSIELSCDDEVTVMADSPLLEQAAVNLLDNAIKYSAAGETIRITTRMLDGEIQVSVADNGPGIPKKHLPRLFERFYRVDKARSRQVGGTGLGLAIVKHIAQAHGGHVTVESEVNKGSTFTLHLPRPVTEPSAG